MWSKVRLLVFLLLSISAFYALVDYSYVYAGMNDCEDCAEGHCCRAGCNGCNGRKGECCDGGNNPDACRPCGGGGGGGGGGSVPPPCSETNVAPAEPTGIYFCTGSSSNCTAVTGDLNNPTVVVHDTPSEDVHVTATAIIPPESNSPGLRYKWEIDDLKDPFDCNNDDDSCATDVNPSSWPDIGEIINEGDVYKATFWAGTINRCSSAIMYGPPKTVYFVLDHNPKILITSISGQSGTEPDSDNGVSCNDNNPFTFDITYRDLDGIDNLESLKFWIDNAQPNRSLAQESAHGMVKISGSNYQSYGYSCNNSGGNCDWNVVGSALPSASRSICTIDGDWSDYLSSSEECDGAISGWTATNIVSNSTDITVTFKSWIYDDIGSDLTVYGEGIDIHGAESHWRDVGDWLLDLEGPDIQLSDLIVVGSNTVNLPWSVTDRLSSVSDLRGHSEIVLSGYNDGPIYDETSGVNNYVITRTYDHLVDRLNPLWQLNSPTNRTERINLLNNEGNEIDFWATAHDSVCNEAESNHVVQDLDSPWITTRGGNVYSTGGTNVNTQAIEDDDGSTVYGITKDSLVWVTPFRFEIGTISNVPLVNNDVALSTELYLVGPGAALEITDTYLPSSGYGVTGYDDRSSGDLYTIMAESNEIAHLSNSDMTPIALAVSDIDTGTYPTSTSLPQCDLSKDVCVLSSTDLTVTTSNADAAFTCDKPTVFMVDGDLTIGPDIIKGGGVLDGCLFIVSGDITISSGMDQDINPSCNASVITDADVCYPAYDLLEAMLLADGQIILDTDKHDLLNEGLLVHGSVIARGGDTDDSSIVWRRSQKLANNLRFPSVIVHGDPVYYGIIRKAFDISYVTYNLDYGFRPI